MSALLALHRQELQANSKAALQVLHLLVVIKAVRESRIVPQFLQLLVPSASNLGLANKRQLLQLELPDPQACASPQCSGLAASHRESEVRLGTKYHG